MTRKEIITLIEKKEIRVIGKRTDAKVGAKDEKVMAYIKENKQEIIDIYFDEEERKQKEKQERLEKRRMERKEKLYSNPETKVYIKKNMMGKS